jgi:hypothetical protein
LPIAPPENLSSLPFIVTANSVGARTSPLGMKLF